MFVRVYWMTTNEEKAKEFLVSFVRARRREVSLRAALGQCGPESDAAMKKQLEEEIAASVAARDRICQAANRLPGAQRDVIVERYLSPAPIKIGKLIVGWRLKSWEEIAETWGYTRRHMLRLHKAALREISSQEAVLSFSGKP